MDMPQGVLHPVREFSLLRGKILDMHRPPLDHGSAHDPAAGERQRCANLQASDVPLALQMLGLAMYLLSTGFIMWVFRVNSFAAPVVKVQTERHHHVISSGPYAWVRHPMYSGVMLFFFGAPLLVGSWWGVLIAPLFAVLFAARAGIEERALAAGLPDYADYAARVRYRLVPGVW